MTHEVEYLFMMDLPFGFLFWINAIYILGTLKNFLLGDSTYYFGFRGLFLGMGESVLMNFPARGRLCGGIEKK